MRDKLIHDYFGVDNALVWAVVTDVLPGFSARVEELVGDPHPRE
jgi:uncharacterized protein with HEPN domain